MSNVRFAVTALSVSVLMFTVGCRAEDLESGAARATDTGTMPAQVGTATGEDQVASEPSDEPSSPSAPPTTLDATCPVPQGREQLVRLDSAGICFLIPEGFEALVRTETSATVLAPEGVEGHRERMFLDVEPAEGRSAEEAANGLLAVYGLPAGLDDAPSPSPALVTVGGRDAYWIGGLPGQDINRRLVVVADDTLYSAMFVPDDPEMRDAHEQMETMYDQFVSSAEFVQVDETPVE